MWSLPWTSLVVRCSLSRHSPPPPGDTVGTARQHTVADPASVSDEQSMAVDELDVACQVYENEAIALNRVCFALEAHFRIPSPNRCRVLNEFSELAFPGPIQ